MGSTYSGQHQFGEPNGFGRMGKDGVLQEGFFIDS